MRTAATTTEKMVAFTAIAHPARKLGQHQNRVSHGGFSAAADHSQTAEWREQQVRLLSAEGSQATDNTSTAIMTE